MVEGLLHLNGFEGRKGSSFDIQREIQIPDDGGYLTAEVGYLLVLLQVLPLLSLELMDVLIDPFDGAEPLQELRCALRADAGNPGDVV